MARIQPLILSSDDGNKNVAEDKAILEILSEKTVVQSDYNYESLDEKTCVVLSTGMGVGVDAGAEAFNTRVNSENGLISSAMPLIHYAMSLLSINDAVDIDMIRTRLISDIGRFENKAEQCFSDHSQIVAARYLLCSFIDEIVSTSPWGQSHRWSGESLLSYFHNETYGGEGFFKLLERAQKQPANYLDLLELMYVCLSLGFAGRYRLDSEGTTKLEGVRESMMTTIAQYRAPDNRSLVVGETKPRDINLKNTRIKLLQWLAPAAVIVLIVVNSVSYMLASHEIDSQMDMASRVYFLK